MNLEISDNAKKQLKRLPKNIQQKTHKSFSLLLEDYRHPSLRSKKMSGTTYFEARIDYHYRFTFSIENETINILHLGSHDEGLGKK